MRSGFGVLSASEVCLAERLERDAERRNMYVDMLRSKYLSG